METNTVLVLIQQGAPLYISVKHFVLILSMQMMTEKVLMRPSRSLTMESISPEDLPRHGDSPDLPLVSWSGPWLVQYWLHLPVLVEFLEAVRQQVQKFEVQYIGNLPVSRAMGKDRDTLVTPECPFRGFSQDNLIVISNWCLVRNPSVLKARFSQAPGFFSVPEFSFGESFLSGPGFS